ncbi:MAG: isoprenylcysteine carboxylmethyltransferase family protein [Pseudoxanthomonas sp.]
MTTQKGTGRPTPGAGETMNPPSTTTQASPRSRIHRIAVFSYGIASYAIGVAALVGLILFMLGVFRFRGTPLGDLGLGAALTVDALLLITFAVQHSLMARPGFKARWTRIIPPAAERSTYVLMTGLVIVLWLALWQPMPTIVWSLESPMLRWTALGVALVGWAYLFLATFAINHFELFGLQQVWQALRGHPLTPALFQERWMYRFDRHPLMTGVLVGVWVTPTMTLDHLLFAAGTTLYVWIGVFFEERSLQRQFGRRYEDYRQRVGTIVPTFASWRPERAKVAGHGPGDSADSR